MKKKNTLICIAAALSMSLNTFAQIETDEDYDDGLGLYYDEEEDTVQKPKHKEYKNMLHVQYSPSQYHFDGATPHLHFQEFSMGWAHIFQVEEEKPYFVELGVQAKYSHSGGDDAHQHAKYSLLTFRVPINVSYKLYLSSHRDIALAPFAGVYVRATAVANEKLGGTKTSLLDHKKANTTGAEWEWAQLGWQVGLRMWWQRYFVGVSYGRDFPDDSKLPQIHECGVHVGVCF